MLLRSAQGRGVLRCLLQRLRQLPLRRARVLGVRRLGRVRAITLRIQTLTQLLSTAHL